MRGPRHNNQKRQKLWQPTDAPIHADATSCVIWMDFGKPCQFDDVIDAAWFRFDPFWNKFALQAGVIMPFPIYLRIYHYSLTFYTHVGSVSRTVQRLTTFSGIFINADALSIRKVILFNSSTPIFVGGLLKLSVYLIQFKSYPSVYTKLVGNSAFAKI